MFCVILYGPPASGKDTITTALTSLDPRFQLFPRLKAGSGKTATYRMTTEHELDAMRKRGEVAWENHRYSATYAVDIPELRARLAVGVPVLHLGQVAAIDAVRRAIPDATWLTVALVTPRAGAAERLAARSPCDLEERLAAWDATEHLAAPDLVIDTGTRSPTEAASMILGRSALTSGVPEGP